MPWKSQLEKDGFEAQRQVPPEISKKQIEEEIPLSWKADNMLWGYVQRYMLKGSGAGFVTPPYTAYWERIWGAVPIEDLHVNFVDTAARSMFPRLRLPQWS